MDEFKEELSLGQRLTDTDILELHILIEQASHEIRKFRPEVGYEFDTHNMYLVSNQNSMVIYMSFFM